jgi:uncharacterized protein YkwD
MPRTQAATRLFPLVAILVLAAFSGAEAQRTSDSTSETSGPDFRGKVEKETFILVNQYRKASDLPPLTWDGAIAKEARAHSKDMATGEVDFGHDGFGDRVSRLKAVMTGLGNAGENVFMTDNLDQVARNAVTKWLHSPHHLQNIRGDYNYSGLGVWQDKEGVIYFTQIFVKIKPPAQETQAAPPPSVMTSFGMIATPKMRAAR